MSGLFTIAARLSDGTVVSGKGRKEAYVGVRTITDENYFLKVFNEYLQLPVSRLSPLSNEEAVEKYEEYEEGSALVAPYHYGLCFIDFKEKTVDYFNIDNKLGYIHKIILFEHVKDFFHEYCKKLSAGNYLSVIRNILDNEPKNYFLANFVSAHEKGCLKQKNVNFLTLAQAAFSDKGNDSIPNVFEYDIKDWKVSSNKNDVDINEFKNIKENLLRKNILTEYDLIGWELFQKEIFK